MNRRNFLSSLAAAGAVAALSRGRAEPASASQSSSSPVRVGLIGCGWYGGVVLDAMMKATATQVTSLCDPHRRALQTTSDAVQKFGQAAPRTFADFREMLKSGDHDVVIVSTPDHWHALPAIAAMQAGADVIMEKPISVDVLEGDALVAAARKYNRVVQVNLQRRSTRCLAEARDKYIRSGRIGKIGAVETFSYMHGRPKNVLSDAQAPSELDWELWTGPAPLRPYRRGMDSRAWRAFMEYGNGQIGDLGVHMLDTVRWMLELGWPETISSNGGIYVDRETNSNISDTQRSVFKYPQFDVVWEHRTWGVAPLVPRHWTDLWGARILGSEGTLILTIAGYEYIPAGGAPREGFNLLSATGNLENYEESRFTAGLEEIQQQHVRDFMQARQTRSRPISDVEEGHISSAACILANIAQEVGRPLRYDPRSRTVLNDPEATAKMARTYRGPWEHPDPARV